MSTSFWTGRGHGVFNTWADFGRGTIDRHSFILANICELSAPQGEDLDFPFQGDATMRIHNIVPLDDGTVHFHLEIDWDSDLNYRLGIAVLN